MTFQGVEPVEKVYTFWFTEEAEKYLPSTVEQVPLNVEGLTYEAFDNDLPIVFFADCSGLIGSPENQALLESLIESIETHRGSLTIILLYDPAIDTKLVDSVNVTQDAVLSYADTEELEGWLVCLFRNGSEALIDTIYDQSLVRSDLVVWKKVGTDLKRRQKLMNKFIRYFLEDYNDEDEFVTHLRTCEYCRHLFEMHMDNYVDINFGSNK